MKQLIFRSSQTAPSKASAVKAANAALALGEDVFAIFNDGETLPTERVRERRGEIQALVPSERYGVCWRTVDYIEW